MLRIGLIVCALLCLIPFVDGAFAQDGGSQSLRITKEQIDEIGKAVHARLAEGKIGAGELIGEERAKTLKYPLISYDMMEFVIVRGRIAGFAQHCGLDWQNKFYVPLMKALRAQFKTHNDYQWAYVGMLHGASMNAAEQSVKGQTCDEAMKANIAAAALK
jgi:hypothetical protein